MPISDDRSRRSLFALYRLYVSSDDSRSRHSVKDGGSPVDISELTETDIDTDRDKDRQREREREREEGRDGGRER